MNSQHKNDETEPLSARQIQACITTLNRLLKQPEELFELAEDERIALLKAAGQLARPHHGELQKRKKDIKKAQKRKQAERDKHARKLSGIRSARESEVFFAPDRLSPKELDQQQTHTLGSARNCYVCKKEFTELHHFYDSMCKSCGDLNYSKRFQTTNLSGQTALVTGSRLKIGYHIVLMLLRAGAKVIAATRFPHDSALRYSKEEDYNDWKDRLQIHGLDLRHIPSVELFCDYLQGHLERLDFLINNAAQTVRRPAGFYAHLMPNETMTHHELPEEAQLLLHSHKLCVSHISEHRSFGANTNIPVSWQSKQIGIGITSSAALSQIPYSIDQALAEESVFPQGQLDADLQQVDLRKTNSWRLKLGEINTVEMLEVQLVNAVAPFVLCNRMIELMKREKTGQKHVVNVSAMEGKFYRFHKAARHPHTNMAKAALNMLTHTSAADLAKSGIFMNAVDTGWVTDEDPAELAKFKQEKHDFQPPLDIVDGAARVLDPIFDGINTGKHWCGKFLKDYFPIDW